MKRTQGLRSIGRGLAKVEPANSDTLIAFAAKAGSTAADGEGGNSPFTAALLNNIAVPGLDIRLAFGRVRDEVLKFTSQKQEPFLYGSVGGAVLSLVSPEPIPTPTPSADPIAEVRRDYDRATEVGTKEAWDSFLNVYSRGFYSDLARAQRSKVIAADKAGAAAAEASARAAAAAKAQREAETTERFKAAALVAAAEKTRADAKIKSAAEAEKAWFQAAEKARAEADARAKADDEKRAKAAVEQAKLEQKLAALTSRPGPDSTPPKPTLSPSETTRLLQAQLRRVGCEPGAVDGIWGQGTRRAIEAFNKNSGARLDTTQASLEALNALKAKAARVCPLGCRRGYRVEGDRCVAIDSEKSKIAVQDKPSSQPEARARPAELRSDIRAACLQKVRNIIDKEFGMVRGSGSGIRSRALFHQCMASGGEVR
jgi:hypothetical protein